MWSSQCQKRKKTGTSSNADHTTSVKKVPKTSVIGTGKPTASNNASNNTSADISAKSSTQKADKSDTPNKNSASYTCQFCHMSLTRKHNLYRHQRTVHGEKVGCKKNDHSDHSMYKCHMCSKFTCTTTKQLIQHYQSQHNKEFRIEQRTFNTEQAFKDWKKETEKQTSAQYVLLKGAHTSTNFVTRYFQCNRSGESKNLASRKRCLKNQGYCKMGSKCTSYITVRRSLADGTLVAEYCLDHIGHSLKLGHLRVSDDLKATIAAKLEQGVEPNSILDNVRNKMAQIDRDSLLTRRDIQNIVRRCNVAGIRKNENDSVSVDLWVQQLQNDEHDPVLCYKAQGTEHPSLNKEDFVLGLQTLWQREMMMKHASKIVCIDSTHGTNQYDFLVTTVLVLDEYEEGIPVAWMISNREDTDILQFFLQELKEMCHKNLTTDIFMSDLANNFYNAWCQVFPKPVQRLYCSWHVDRAWRKNLQQHIQCKELRQEICNLLKVL